MSSSQPHPFLNALITLSVIGLIAAAILGLTGCANSPSNDAAVKQNATLPLTEPAPPTVSPAVRTPVDFDCADSSNRHPVGLSVAETYEIPYEQVIAWHCEGYSFENILIALETSEATGIPAGALLEMLLEKDWEQIWEEVGFMPPP